MIKRIHNHKTMMLFLQHKPFTRKHLMARLPAEIPARDHIFNQRLTLNSRTPTDFPYQKTVRALLLPVDLSPSAYDTIRNH